MSAITLLISLPFRAFLYLIRHPKLLAICVIGICIIVGFNTCSSSNPMSKSNNNNEDLPDYQVNAPGINTARYMLQTDSRLYYVTEYKGGEDQIILTKYWVCDKSTWLMKSNTLVLTSGQFKGVLYDRKNNKILMRL